MEALSSPSVLIQVDKLFFHSCLGSFEVSTGPMWEEGKVYYKEHEYEADHQLYEFTVTTGVEFLSITNL